jgi:hypothetical protein
VLSPAARQLIAGLATYGQARGWTLGTARRARRAVTAVLAGSHDLGQPPWDTGTLERFLNQRHLTALRAIEFLTDQGLARGNPWQPCAPG